MTIFLLRSGNTTLCGHLVSDANNLITQLELKKTALYFWGSQLVGSTHFFHSLLSVCCSPDYFHLEMLENILAID